jgi:hypothetical protein
VVLIPLNPFLNIPVHSPFTVLVRLLLVLFGLLHTLPTLVVSYTNDGLTLLDFVLDLVAAIRYSFRPLGGSGQYGGLARSREVLVHGSRRPKGLLMSKDPLDPSEKTHNIVGGGVTLSSKVISDPDTNTIPDTIRIKYQIRR